MFMIKKKNKILVSVLALLLTVTVGYALFSEELLINGTASAQGNFDLTYECFEIIESGGTGSCTPPNEQDVEKIVTTTSNLTKPGDAFSAQVKITNTGSIPVLLESVSSPNNYLMSEMVVGDEFYLDNSTWLGAYYLVAEQMNSEGTEFENPIYGDSAVSNKKFTLQPGESMLIHISHLWGDASISENVQPALPEGGATMNYNLKFDFVQAP